MRAKIVALFVVVALIVGAGVFYFSQSTEDAPSVAVAPAPTLAPEADAPADSAPDEPAPEPATDAVPASEPEPDPAPEPEPESKPAKTAAAPAIAPTPPPDNLRAGRDYLQLSPAQPVRTGAGKIEILEFFNYSCPHCYRMQGKMKQWLAKNSADDIQLVYQPVVFQRYNGHFARVYYTLVGLRLADEFSPKVYNAIHHERVLINSKGRFLDWLEEQGVERERAESVYDSFSVATRAERAEIAPLDYGVESTPQIAVNGKYVIHPGLSGSYDAMLDTLTALIARERAARP